MSKVTGKTAGVAADILAYLEAVAEYYGPEIKIYSGKRSAEESATAVFNNWSDLERGSVYRADTLSSEKKTRLDGYYKTAVEDFKAKYFDKQKAKEEFLKLAGDTIGQNTLHYSGRAVDILKSSGLTDNMRAAIRMAPMKEIIEPKVYHYQSGSTIPATTEEMKKKWPKK
jgi:hypothetical protein